MSQLKFGLIVEVNNGFAIGVVAGFGLLYQINTDSGRCTFLNKFFDENIVEEVLFSAACCVNENIYFAPQSARHIWKYNIPQNALEKIEFPNKFGKKFKFFDVINVKDKCYFFSASRLSVLELDVNTDEFEEIYECCDNNIFFRSGMLIDNSYFYCSIKGNDFIEYKIVDKKFVIHKLPLDFRGAFSIDKYKNKIVLAPRYCGDAFLFFDIKTGNYDICSDPYIKEKMNELAYLYCVVSGDCIYAMADINMDSVKINLKTNEFSIISELSKKRNQKMGVYNRLKGKTIVGFLGQENSYYYDNVELKMFDHNTGKSISYVFWEGETKAIKNKSFLRHIMFRENKNFGLSEFLNCV